MKTIHIIPILLSLSACNNSGKVQNAESNDSASAEHAHHHDAAADTTAISADQNVFFENLSDGQEITLPFVVKFGVQGMEVEPAQGVNPNKGHHHLLIDQNFVPAGTMVPMGKENEGYYHFGKAQTSDTLSLKKYPGLSPGKHSLRLQFANGLHQSYGPAMSAAVNIVVKK
jgi:hypothetical protein